MTNPTFADYLKKEYRETNNVIAGVIGDSSNEQMVNRYAILLALQERPMSTDELCKLFNYSGGAMFQLLKTMEHVGMLIKDTRRAPSGHDIGTWQLAKSATRKLVNNARWL